jgi:hypothetical protein
MNPFFSGPQIVSLFIALAVIGLAVAGILWVGRVIRGELGSPGGRDADPSKPGAPRHVSPAMNRPEPAVSKPSPPAAAIAADVPPAMRAILDAEKLRVWCPMCGTELQLPTFPPLVSRCSTCGKKSVIRAEEGGRYVVIVSPPPKMS